MRNSQRTGVSTFASRTSPSTDQHDTENDGEIKQQQWFKDSVDKNSSHHHLSFRMMRSA